MTLTTHAVVGAAAASAVPSHPILGFFAGFMSHFLVDAIPHWHYPVSSIEENPNDPMQSDMKVNREAFVDFLTIGFDGSLGIVLSLILLLPLHHLWMPIVIGALAGIFPDGLQFCYWKFRYPPLTWLQRFHIWIHAKTDLDHSMMLGPSLQIALICIATLFARVIA